MNELYNRIEEVFIPGVTIGELVKTLKAEGYSEEEVYKGFREWSKKYIASINGDCIKDGVIMSIQQEKFLNYIEEDELIKVEYKRREKEIEEKFLTSRGRDSYAIKERREAMRWFLNEVDKLKEKYNILHINQEK